MLGAPAAVALGLAFLYFNPSDAAEFQRNTMDRLSSVQTQYDASQAMLNELRTENLRQMAQINLLKQQLLTIQSTEDSWPYPAWFKDASGRVLFANAAYDRLYLRPRGYVLTDYVGQDDYAVWPKDIADAFRANDQRVMETGQHIVIAETIEMPGGPEKHLFIKYPRRLGGVVVGVAGRFLPAVGAAPKTGDES